MAEAVFAHRDCAIACERINLQRLRQQFSMQIGHAREHLPEVLLHLGGALGVTIAPVVVELQIVREHCHQPRDVVRVERVEHRGVHARDRVEQLTRGRLLLLRRLLRILGGYRRACGERNYCH